MLLAEEVKRSTHKVEIVPVIREPHPNADTLDIDRSSPNVEKVLVFPESSLNEAFPFADMQQLMSDGFIKDSKKVARLLNTTLQPTNLLYIDRDAAESNESFKQLIPYCVLKDGDNIFRYQRTNKSGEARLQGLWSVGVGGHINPCDAGGVLQDTYQSALQRELEEEVSFRGTYRNTILGCLYDASTALGRIHFGIVHLLELEPGFHIHPTDPAVANGDFMPLEYLKNHIEDFEVWSQIVLEHLL